MFLFFQESLLGTNQTKIIKINSVSVIAEVADTLEKRAKGLSERKIFPEGTGMLFIFDNPAQYGFWMKNMNFPIDIVWINEEWQIVGIEKQVSPETFPQIFYPNQVVKYVLELPAGFSDKYRIDIGQYVTI
ncbi:MAG: hypothetical protein A3B03_01000 [Candidatus Zambryskibacteria bacterium RIFCSPLOWO2_01_FULL_42_41]|nr:MAG: hypothetical protein A3B03_01000 [Candidatus Zambryskibacteria bacterium RIFCSPLOWO2_01_FULL_42_41]